MGILIVDDDLISRTLMSRTLARAGFDVREASDAAEAMTRLESEPNVGLLVTDLVMPGMSGLQLVERLRGSARFAGLPVLVCSSNAERASVLLAGRLQVAGYLLKPLDVQRLRGQVSELVDAAGVALDDPARTLRRLDLEAEEYVRMLVMLADKATGLAADLPRIGRAVERHNWQARMTSLGGGARTLGASRLATALDALDPDASAAPAHLRNLEAEIGRLRLAVVGLRRVRAGGTEN
jgi:CheY-like chemotaxis protein